MPTARALTERQLTHSTFALEREYKAAPVSKVFLALADPTLKAKWFDAPSSEWRYIDSSFEFREGGLEYSEN